MNRIVEKNKQTEKPQPAAPAQGGKDRGKGKGDRGRSRGRSQSAKGDKICYKFWDGNCEKGKDCPYKPVKDASRSGTAKKKGKGKGSGRSVSPTRKSKEEMAKIPCTYFQQGNVKMQLHPQRIRNEQIALHQRRRPAQKLRHALPKGMLASQRHKGCQMLQGP